MHFFNTAGSVEIEIHDPIPPLSRFDLDDTLTRIAQLVQRKCCVLHAPRQIGNRCSQGFKG